MTLLKNIAGIPGGISFMRGRAFGLPESFTDGTTTFTVRVEAGGLQIYDETEQVLTETYN